MVVNKCELSKWVIFQLSTKLKEQNYISVHEYIEAGGGGAVLTHLSHGMTY